MEQETTTVISNFPGQTFTTEQVITSLNAVEDAVGLPCGSAVGDRWGGRTFNDSIAAALEARSCGGWLEVGEWTIIVLHR